MNLGETALRAVLASVAPRLRLVASRPLTGGVSAQVTALTAESADGQRTDFVLRCYGQANLAADPRAAVHEFAVLSALHAAGLPVPRPFRADESGAVLPGPWLVTELMPGTAVTEPADPQPAVLGQLAATLAAIHSAGLGRARLPFLTDIRTVWTTRLGTWPESPDVALSEGAIRAALRDRPPPPVVNAARLLHCDYWPGNTLWQDGRLTAVIDWEDALLGDPVADLANSRLELAMFFGLAAAQEFTETYLRLLPGTDLSTLPQWELYAALRPAGKMAGWGMPADQLATMSARHREFTSAALAQLAGPGATSPFSQA